MGPMLQNFGGCFPQVFCAQNILDNDFYELTCHKILYHIFNHKFLCPLTMQADIDLNCYYKKIQK